MQHRFASLLLLGLAGCVVPTAALEARYGELSIDGDATLNSAGSPVSENSLDDMGISGSESSPALVGDVGFGFMRVLLSTESAEWSGDGNVSNFGGINGANVAVDSDLELAIHRGLLTFEIPIPFMDLGFGFGVSAVDVNARVEEQATGTTEKIDELLPIPVLAARAAVGVWRLNFEAVLAGMQLDTGDEEVSYFDADLAARLNMISLGPVDAWLSLGYRFISLDAQFEEGNDDADIDATLDGPYIGLRIDI